LSVHFHDVSEFGGVERFDDVIVEAGFERRLGVKMVRELPPRGNLWAINQPRR